MNKEIKANEFPCEVFIKAIGKQTPELEAAVLMIVKRYVPDMVEEAIQLNPSKNGTYVSMTVKVRAQNQEQVNNIYQELSMCPHIIMAL